MCKKKLFVCSFFILLLLCGCHNRKTQIKSQKLESATTLEQEISKKTETRKWKKKLVDETGNKSYDELSNIENEVVKMLNQYQGIIFNLDKNTINISKSASISSFLIPIPVSFTEKEICFSS